MSQVQRKKGGSRRRRSVWSVSWRHLRGFWAFVLSFSVIFANLGSSVGLAVAGSGTVKEEFRLHAEDIQEAAERAVYEEEPLTEVPQISGKDKSLVKEYEELFSAEGNLYEIFPDYQTVKDAEGIELRIFVRIDEDADPASYIVTGEEELIFLYVNGSDEPIAARLNIDGYMTGFSTVKPYETMFGEAGPSVQAGGSIKIDSAGKTAESSAPEKEAAGGAEESTGEMLPADTEINAGQETDAEKQAPASEAEEEDLTDDESERDSAGDAAEDPEEAPAAGSDENLDEAAGNAESEKNGVSEKEDAAEPEGADDTNQAAEKDSAEAENAGENAADDADDHDKGELDDAADTADTDDGSDGKDGAGEAQLSMSLNQIRMVAAGMASASNADPANEKSNSDTAIRSEDRGEEADEEEEEKEEELDPGAPFDEEDAAAQKAEEDSFKRIGTLEGKLHNAVAFGESSTARAFTTSLDKMGINTSDLAEAGHIMTYTISPVGTAALVRAPELVRDEAVVTFGIVPQEGYMVYQVLANGEEVGQSDEAVLASSSDAVRKPIASSSEATKADADAEYAEEDAVFYTIPDVLEDQEVEILLVEEALGTHPAFHQAKTVNGVTVTVEAEEGILPAGTTLSVEEVTEQVADAVKEKVESQDTEDRINVTSVIAYDINLMLYGKKLNSSWGDDNQIMVNFSGDRIKTLSEEADELQAISVDTPTETVEAALGGVEEVPVVDRVTAEDIEVNTEGREAIDVNGDASVEKVAFATSFANVQAVYGARGAVQPLEDTSTGDLPFIRVRKNFDFKESKIPEAGIAESLNNYVIELQDSKGNLVSTLMLKDGQEEILGNSYFWEVPNLYDTKYYVQEKNASLPEYNLLTEPQNIENQPVEVEVKQASFSGASFTKYPKGCDTEMTPNVDTFRAFCISSTTGEFFVWTQDSLSLAERQIVVEAISGAGGTFNGIGKAYKNTINNPESPTVFFYSNKYGEDTLSTTGIYIRSVLVRYNNDTQIISMSKPDQWNMIAFGTYNKENALGADIEITNTYTLKNVLLALVKKLENCDPSTIPEDASVVFQLYSAEVDGADWTKKEQLGEDIVFNKNSFTQNENDEKNCYSTQLKQLEQGNYILCEKSTIPGYQKLDEEIHIRVKIEGDELKCFLVDKSGKESLMDWEKFTDSPIEEVKNAYVFQIENHTSPELPQTGGPGLGLIKEFGWMLLLMAAVMAGVEAGPYSRRRKDN